MLLTDYTPDGLVSLEVFRTWMANGVQTLTDRINAQVESEQRSEVRQYLERERARLLAPNHLTTNLDEDCKLGFFGSAMIEAMGEALYTMPMGQWERFYQGHVLWSKSLPGCTYKGREEENARGAMLMALRYRCEDLQHRLDRIDFSSGLPGVPPSPAQQATKERFKQMEEDLQRQVDHTKENSNAAN